PAPTNVLPSVAITSPVWNESFGLPAKVMLAASASDVDGSIAGVDFYVNGTFMGRDTAAPYTLSWVSWTVGSYSVVAVATDNQGGSTTSSSVTFRVDDRTGTLHGFCSAPDPFGAIGGGSCVSGVWLPPGYSMPPDGISPTTIPVFENSVS